MTRDKPKLLKRTTILLFTAVILFCAFGAHAGNIDPDGTGCKYAWGENAGWINFKPSQGDGVTVSDTAVAGMAWGENIGWINLSPTNGGVVNDGTGKLSGYAWGENVGWINFNPTDGGVSIGSDGKFTGYAWGENSGWINFSSSQSCVKTAWSANRPPVAVCQNVTAAAGSTCTATASIDNGSYDPDGDTITLSQSPPGPYQKGDTLATLTVTDSKSASSQCTGTVSVIDNTQPSITAPEAVTAYTGPGSTSCGTIVNDTTLGTETASDNCPGVTVTRSGVPSGNLFPVGTTAITYTAKDASDNVATAAQTVTVIDNTPPTISGVSASPSTLWPPNYKMVDATINYSATDNCGQPACKISGVTSNEPISSSDYSIVDGHHVKLSADRLGSGTGRIYTITIACTDASGNSSIQTVTVSVPHDQGKK